MQNRRLTLFLLGYGLFILAGSLYPFTGWAPQAAPPLDFLSAPWPKYFTRTDLATNLLTYAPLGYGLARWFALPGHPLRGVLLGVMAGALLSIVCETAQHYLPGRIASNLDFLVNVMGTLLGALLAIHHSRWLRAFRATQRWRLHWFRSGKTYSLGLALLAAWLLAQFALVPISGIGWLSLHLRPLDSPPDGLNAINTAWLFALWAELATLGAFAGCLLRPGRYVGGLALLFIVAFIAKLLVATILLKLTVVGGVLSLETLTAFSLALWLLLLPWVSRHRKAVALAMTLLLVFARWSLAAHFWPGASILNLVGLAKAVGAGWPMAAFLWLLWATRSRRR